MARPKVWCPSGCGRNGVATYEIARGLSEQAVRGAELIVTPYTSFLRGIAAEGSVRRWKAPLAKQAYFGVELVWSLDIPASQEFRWPT